MTIAPAAASQCPFHVAPEQVLDFNLNDAPGVHHDPYDTISELRRTAPRIFYTTRNSSGKQPGSWFLTNAEDIRHVLRNAALFSSQGNAGFSKLLGEQWDLVPLELDGARHGEVRHWANPLFSSAAVKKMEPAIRATCTSRIAEFSNAGGCEFVNQFGRPYPVTVVLQLMGLSVDALPLFLQWEDELLHSRDMTVKIAAARSIKDFLLAEIEDRRAHPRDDLFSQAVRAQIKGEPLSDNEVLGFCYLMFVGGLDTVASSLGFHFKYLAEHPELQQRLRDDPAMIPQAVEELLRRFAVVTMHRRATADTEIAGTQIKAGDWITLATPMAAMDDTAYPAPGVVDFDRANKSHVTLAFGPHTCMGMHLARLELIVALQEWTTRLPVFRIKPDSEVRMHAGAVFGVDELHLAW
jgi:cytochrome P450